MELNELGVKMPPDQNAFGTKCPQIKMPLGQNALKPKCPQLKDNMSYPKLMFL